MSLKQIESLLVLVLLASIAGCATQHSTSLPLASAPSSPSVSTTSSAATPASPSAPQSFFAALRAECGRAFGGRVVADEPPPTGDNPFAGKTLVMHVRECTGTELRIPFHVGEDRSRTWVITRTPSGLRLKHDHRHDDGSDDVLTQYGGDTAEPGSTRRQSFPVDADSIVLFEREQRAVSTTNTWALELDPGRVFVYELTRPGGRLFRVEFDLSKPVAIPPPPWGDPR